MGKTHTRTHTHTLQLSRDTYYKMPGNVSIPTARDAPNSKRQVSHTVRAGKQEETLAIALGLQESREHSDHVSDGSPVV